MTIVVQKVASVSGMTYLQLCNSLIQKCGISGGSISSVANQVGEALRVVNWIAEAYIQIQLASPTWNWMRSDVSFSTVSNQGSYLPSQAGVTDFANWKTDSFRCYVTSTGVRSEMFLEKMDYDTFRDTYLFGNLRLSYSRPTVISFAPNYSINLGMAPDSTDYTIVGEYFKQPTTLVNSTDTPAMPSQFHNIIVYKAMMMYGMYEAAQEVVIEGANLYNQMLRRLVRDQLPDAESAGALA